MSTDPNVYNKPIAGGGFYSGPESGFAGAQPAAPSAPVTSPTSVTTPTSPATTGADTTPPITPASPTGVSDMSFISAMNGISTSFQNTNSIIDQKNAMLQASMGQPVDPKILAKLPANMQSLISSGNRDAMRMQAQSLSDSIAGNSSSVASSIQYLTTGYENAVKTANDQKQQELDNLMKLASTFVDPKTGTVDIKKAGDAFKALYPGVDMTGVISQLSGMMPVSEYNKGLQYGLQPPAVGATDPVSMATSAIVGNESDGNYNTISAPIKGGQYAGQQSYGKYQVLASNIPSWTAEATGTSMTPEQFIADPTAQDAVVKMQIGKYWTKYGNIADVASMWFTGVPAAQSKGMVDKTTGMTSEQYIQKATDAYNKANSTAAVSADPVVQSWVENLKSGAASSLASVPAKYKNLVSQAMADQNVQVPLGDRRYVMAANGIIANYLNLPAYTLTANAQPYLLKIDAAMGVAGSVSDQDLLDSYTKLSTSGSVITDAQVSVITGGKSVADSINVLDKKYTEQGGVLSDSQRQQIYSLGHEIYKNLQAGYQPVYDAAIGKLKASDIPEQFWTLPDLNTLSNLSQKAVEGRTGTSGGGSPITAPDGTQVIISG